MHIPRVAAIHDMSGFGRCSLTVILPILSAMGVQCCPVPTAFLSTHTGGFEGCSFHDMTDEIPKISAHWSSLNLDFQSIYSGFLGSTRQISMVSEFIRTFRRSDTIVVIDPVMGDHGKIYRTYTPAMCAGTLDLAKQADVITPNLTEAAIMLGVPYDSLPEGESGCREIVERLCMNGQRSVVLTGASSAPNLTGAMCFDAKTGKTTLIQTEKIPHVFVGTGDIFTSVLTGSLVKGISLPDGVKAAAEFVRACGENTVQNGTPTREGVDFEPLLGILAGR